MKILVLTSRVPYPLDKGDKLRIYHQLKYLSSHHEVLLCALGETSEKNIQHLSEICSVKTFKLNKFKTLVNLFLALFSDQPFQVKYFYQKSVHKKIKQTLTEFKPDHIYCQLIRCSEYVKNEHDIPKTLDYMDVFSKGMERRIKHSKFWLKPFVKAEYKRLLRYENLMFEYFENKTIISKQDRDYIYHKNRKEIHVISNGVDTNFFEPQEQEKQFDLVFVGNLNYPPNIKACLFIVNHILPLLSEDVKVLLSGATPSQQVLSLSSSNVEVRSWVDDIRNSYASGKIFVAPMFTGTGLQNKLLEAMSMGLPCITTSLVNNALNANSSKEIFIAENAQEFAEKITFLLSNENQKQELAQNGQKFIQQNYSWDKYNKQLEDIIKS